MKATISKKALSAAIKQVATVINNRASLLVLRSVRIDIEDSKVIFTGSDADLWLAKEVQATDTQKGSFLVEFKRFKDLATKIKTKDVTLEAHDGKLNINGTINIPYSEITDFPAPALVRKHHEAFTTTFTITDAYKNIEKHCANDSQRPQMGGIFFDTDKNTIVASDGHSLHAAHCEFSMKPFGGFILPITAYKNLKGETQVTIFRSPKNVEGYNITSEWFSAFTDEGVSMVGHTIEGRYPNWRSVIPTTSFEEARYTFADTAAVRDALHAFDSFSTELIVFRFTDGSDIASIVGVDIDYDTRVEQQVKLTTPAKGNYRVGVSRKQFATVPNSWNGTMYSMENGRAITFELDAKSSAFLLMPMLIDEYDGHKDTEGYNERPLETPIEDIFIFTDRTQEEAPKSEPKKKAEPKAKKSETHDSDLSPMMKQFYDLKKKHPDALILFRCGDFYETYEKDAEEAARILGITLTKSSKTRNKEGKPLAMAGFPHHALDTYLPKLIRAGKRVAICDQIEDPRPKAKRNQSEPKPQEQATKQPSDAEEVISKANANEPQPKNFIPRFPDYVMWVNEDKKEPDMVAGIHQFLPVADHMSEEDATIYYKIPAGSDFMLCLETSIYLKAVDKMVVFSFYAGTPLTNGPVCKMTNGDNIQVYTWEEGQQALDIIHQVNKDVAM